MRLPLDEIKIKKRVRQDMGDLKQLMESLQEYGLMNPIIVSKKMELIAGHRRLEAARLLGWQFIEAHVIEKSSAAYNLELEIEENVRRKDLTDEELNEALRRLEKLRNPGIFKRLLSALINLLKRLFGRY
jgi:ParB family chromosome partitioning protein